MTEERIDITDQLPESVHNQLIFGLALRYLELHGPVVVKGSELDLAVKKFLAGHTECNVIGNRSDLDDEFTLTCTLGISEGHND